MKREKTIAGLLKVLSCLVFAFALAFFPPTSVHAAQGVHGDHAGIEQSDSHDALLGHGHAAEMDCGAGGGAAGPDSSPHQCCASMCLSVILLDSFASPPADASRIEAVLYHATLVAADPNGFLRPPKNLI